MQLPSAGFLRADNSTSTPKPVGGLSARSLTAYAAAQKPAGWPRLNAGALPLGVMVFAFLDDFMNLKNLHIQYKGKKPCHPQAAPTCTYRRTLSPINSMTMKLIKIVTLNSKISVAKCLINFSPELEYLAC